MDSELKAELQKQAKSLYSLSKLEQGRRVNPKADGRNLSAFASLETMIQHTVKTPTLVRTQTPEGVPLPAPKPINRSFQDETLIQKLLAYRNHSPLSGRIIRAKIETATPAETAPIGGPLS